MDNQQRVTRSTSVIKRIENTDLGDLKSRSPDLEELLTLVKEVKVLSGSAASFARSIEGIKQFDPLPSSSTGGEEDIIQGIKLDIHEVKIFMEKAENRLNNLENQLRKMREDIKFLTERNSVLEEFVEENDNVFEDSRSTQENIKAIQEEIDKAQMETDYKITSQQRHIDEIKESLKMIQKSHTDTQHTGKGGICISKDKIEEIEQVVTKIDKNLRRRNIIVQGVQEEIQERPGLATTQIQELLKTKLELTGINIDEAFRLGKKERNCCRPILVKCVTLADKQLVITQRSKLKGTDIYLDDDLSIEDRRIGARIRRWAKMERALGKKVKVGYRKLIVEDEVWFWDVEQGDLRLDE